SATTEIEVVARSSVHYCYTITNNSGAPITLQTLFDDNGATIVEWTPGMALADGATLSPTASNGLIRTVSIQSATTSRATWTVWQGGQAFQVQSQAATVVRIVAPQIEVRLTIGAVSTACSSVTSHVAPIDMPREGGLVL
ncbi:MAG: hypothetical protein ACK47M_01825, partial [Caldilinea sp.]